MTDPYGDVSMCPSESPTECPSVKPSEKVNICTCQLCWPSPPLFLLLLPNPNSLHLQTTKNLIYYCLSNTSVVISSSLKLNSDENHGINMLDEVDSKKEHELHKSGVFRIIFCIRNYWETLKKILNTKK